MADLFRSAGRDWNMIAEGRPGPALIEPLLVSRQLGPLTVCNDVPITPHTTLDACPPVDVLCVPEVNLPPGEPLAERYRAEIACLDQEHKRGAILAAACSGAMLFAEAGLLDDQVQPRSAATGHHEALTCI